MTAPSSRCGAWRPHDHSTPESATPACLFQGMRAYRRFSRRKRTARGEAGGRGAGRKSAAGPDASAGQGDASRQLQAARRKARLASAKRALTAYARAKLSRCGAEVRRRDVEDGLAADGALAAQAVRSAGEGQKNAAGELGVRVELERVLDDVVFSPSTPVEPVRTTDPPCGMPA